MVGRLERPWTPAVAAGLRAATSVVHRTALRRGQRVVAGRAEGYRPFDPDVIDATPAELDRQLALVRRYFTVIGTGELRAFLRGAALPPNPAIITFDDGYRECHDRVLPILVTGEGRKAGQKHGRSPYLQAVHFDDTQAQNGDIVPVRILASSQNSLSGARVAPALAPA